jgi:hypothetical protein
VVLRILKHDFEQWLPAAVGLEKIGWFQNNPDDLQPFLRTGLTDQLEVISAGQTPGQRAELAQKTGLERIVVDEIVKMCDFYRTGKNLDHIRAKIYYDMGMDTWQKWAGATSEAIIDRFKEFIRENPVEAERLIPWPKEVRTGIEWAKLHLEIYAIEW